MKKILPIALLLLLMQISCAQHDSSEPFPFVNLEAAPTFPGSFESEVLKLVDISDNGAPSPFRATVYVTFIIEEDGSLSNIKCVRDPGYGLGKEIEEAVKKVKKKWNPGTTAGNPVRVSYNVPIVIKVP